MNTIFGEAIFDPAFPFDGPHLVAASAGTGKTYNIQNICARLVAERGLRVGEIQVMTFTEAATKELRDRIRKVLALFKAYLVDGEAAVAEGERDRLAKLAACVDANRGREKAIEHLEKAIMEFDQAAISTIHGFCRRVLARYAFETGNPFDLELGTSAMADVEARAREWWRENAKIAPDAFRQDEHFCLEEFTAFVKQLSGRSDYRLFVESDPESARDYMLIEVRKVAEAYVGDRLARTEQTFDDLLVALREALNDEVRGPVLAAQLRGEYRAALVDEFQDTDPVQYDIFRHVFLDAADGSHPPIFFVGDPKQAIYSFRGGDIYTYRSAAIRPDVAGMTFHLDRNFRSTPKVIDAVNLVFKDDVRGDTFGDETIDYMDDLKSNPKKEGLLEGGEPDPSPFRVVNVGSVKQGTAALVDGVLELLERPSQDVRPKDIAILVTSHDKGGELRDALRDKGVPVVLQHAGNVFASPVAAELRTVLQAMSLDGGVKRARAALATRFFDVTFEDLVADEDDSLVADMLGFFREIDDIWRKHGFEVAFRKLEEHPKCDLRARLSAMAGGERDIADILQIKDLACKAVHEVGPTPEAMIAWITDRINASADKNKEKDTEEYARELESEADAVKIMTIHVSKGLEYPVVFIVLPAKDWVSEGPYPYHDEAGQLVFSTNMLATPQAGQEQYDEKKRLLYVAMTRASKRTIIIKQEKDCKTWPTAELLGRAQERIGGGAAPSIAWSTYDSDDPLLPDYMAESDYVGTFGTLPEVGRSLESKRPSRGSYTSLSPAGHGSSKTGDDGKDVDEQDSYGEQRSEEEETHPIFKLKGGAKVGVCWHEILENVAFDATPAEIADLTRKTLRIHGLADKDEAVFANDVTTVADMIGKTLHYRLRAPDGTTFALSETDSNARFSEWEFFFPSRAALPWTSHVKDVLIKHWQGDPSKQAFVRAMEGWNRPIPDGFIKGFLDLVFRQGDYYYVVDWKSNQCGREVANFNAQGITAEMAEAGYFFQYMLYAVVLHRFLKETLGAAYSWEKNFGGIKYYFLRGVAAGGEAPVFSDRPSAMLLDELAAVFGLQEG